MTVCDICNFTEEVHTEDELETCKKVRLLNSLLREIEDGDVEFTIGTSYDKDKVIYCSTITRRDTGVSFFGEGSTALEAITGMLE